MRHLRAVLEGNPQAATALAYRDLLVARVRRAGERGDITMGWVLVAAITISIVVLVGGILMGKLQTKAEGLDLTTP